MPLLIIFLLVTTLGSFTLLVKDIDLKNIKVTHIRPTIPTSTPTPFPTSTPTPIPTSIIQDLGSSSPTPTSNPKPTKKNIRPSSSPTPTIEIKHTTPTFKPIPTVNFDQIRQQQEEWWQNAIKNQEDFRKQSEETMEKFRQESEQKMLEFKQLYDF